MMTEQELETYRDNHAALQQFAARYRADAALRARIAGGDYADLHMAVPDGVEIRVVAETPDTYYFPLPGDPNAQVSDQALEDVAGGSTAGTLSTAGTVGSIPSSASSAGSLGCASSGD